MKRNLKSLLKKAKRKAIPITMADAMSDRFVGSDGKPIDTQYELIQMMLPPSMKAFFNEYEQQLRAVCGERHKHDELPGVRWGSQRGSIVIGREKVAIDRERAFDRATGHEIVPEVYRRFQDDKLFNDAVFTEGVKKVSKRDFQKGLPMIAASFGVEKSSISRRWINATAKSLSRLQERKLDELDIVAVFIDGKRFARHGVVVALGVSSTGKKHVLGIYQSDTENSAACKNLLDNLEGRGLPTSGLLFIVDGGSGLNKALNDKYRCHDPKRRRAVRGRCWFHKWRNLEKVLGEHADKCAALYWGILKAASRAEANAAMTALKTQLKIINLSALATLEEAERDLMVIFDLNLSPELRELFSTTNPVESLNSLTGEDLRRVKRWRDSSHFQRWLATSCLHSEKRMHRVKGFRAIPVFRIALAALLKTSEKKSQAAVDSIEQAA